MVIYFLHVQRLHFPLSLSQTTKNISLWNLRQYFMSGFLGRGEFLVRTENLVHALGTVTALCCTDKKGILSWPNASAEKIFLLKKPAEEEEAQNCPKISVNDQVGKRHDSYEKPFQFHARVCTLIGILIPKRAEDELLRFLLFLGGSFGADVKH